LISKLLVRRTGLLQRLAAERTAPKLLCPPTSLAEDHEIEALLQTDIRARGYRGQQTI
jgi:hypothetical protein